ncbi:MAG: TlpA disulfide reductase family protein [Bacteroidales bacterium]|nr:TlpA disulfide reductase family protein [Bacteroidales bacterium]
MAQNSNKTPDDRGFIVKTGEQAPDFTIKFPDNKPSMKLSDLRGKVVMLQFTASWCGVCIKEMPHIEKDIWNTFKNKGLHIYGVDRKEYAEKVLKFAKKTKVTYPLILDEDGSIFKKYADENAGVTRNILIDKEGKIVFMTRLFEQNEFNQLIKKIEELLL